MKEQPFLATACIWQEGGTRLELLWQYSTEGEERICPYFYILSLFLSTVIAFSSMSAAVVYNLPWFTDAWLWMETDVKEAVY